MEVWPILSKAIIPFILITTQVHYTWTLVLEVPTTIGTPLIGSRTDEIITTHLRTRTHPDIKTHAHQDAFAHQFEFVGRILLEMGLYPMVEDRSRPK